jgi:hypothetical protein
MNALEQKKAVQTQEQRVISRPVATASGESLSHAVITIRARVLPHVVAVLMEVQNVIHQPIIRRVQMVNGGARKDVRLQRMALRAVQMMNVTMNVILTAVIRCFAEILV